MSATPLAEACSNCGATTGLFIGNAPLCSACEDCPTCKGTETIGLPVRCGPDDFTSDDFPCPTCQPSAWPHGFPGLRCQGREGWVIEPTGNAGRRTVRV